MNNLNSVLIEGNLVADPDIRYDAAGKATCAFTVASCRNAKVDEKVVHETIMVPVTTQGRLAEVCAEYLKKGRGVRVVGRLAEKTAEAGDATLYVAAEHVEFKPQVKTDERPATVIERPFGGGVDREVQS